MTNVKHDPHYHANAGMTGTPYVPLHWSSSIEPHYTLNSRVATRERGVVWPWCTLCCVCKRGQCKVTARVGSDWTMRMAWDKSWTEEAPMGGEGDTGERCKVTCARFG